MKANELRIGNIVDFVNRTNPLKRPLITPLIVKEVGEIQIKTHGLGVSLHKVLRYDNFFIADIDTIPLTEEWFERFGFEKISDRKYKKDIYTCHWNYGKFNICNPHGFIKNLTYVHEFQNLFFGLTGKELTLK